MLRHLYFYTKKKIVKKLNLSYLGEFGYELISYIPFAYYLHQKGALGTTMSGKDSSCLYYFSKDHIEIDEKRDYIKPKGVPLRNIHFRFLNRFMFSPPPYKAHFKNDQIVFDKPILIICNKYNSEWGHAPISFFDIDTLTHLFDELKDQFSIVYCRPTSNEITDDCSVIYDLNDYEFIRKNYPDVTLIQELHKKFPKLSFNELQMKLFANCDHFISVQGGYSILASYFGGTNIVYGSKTGPYTAREIGYKAYDRWYHYFSGSTMIYVSTYDELFERVRGTYSPSVSIT